ncbi:hypothetical protein [Mesorhizobium metallidurans]|nr:hypothetical protein [Mesorhizobium metallidurans]
MFQRQDIFFDAAQHRATVPVDEGNVCAVGFHRRRRNMVGRPLFGSFQQRRDAGSIVFLVSAGPSDLIVSSKPQVPRSRRPAEGSRGNSIIENAMSRSSQSNLGPQIGLGVDQEIASLLTAIEQEKVPDRLTKLAIELQNALLEKRRYKTTN